MEGAHVSNMVVGEKMIFRFFLLLIGFGLTVMGGISIIAYLNLITAGYTIIYYFQFIIQRIEFHLFIIGFIFIFLSLYIPAGKR